MTFYKLDMKSLPVIEFACSASTDRYRNEFVRRGTLEITTIDGCGIDLVTRGVRYHVPPRSVLVFPPNTVASVTCPAGGTVCDDTIAVRIADMTCSVLNSENASQEDISDEEQVLLPMILTPGDEYTNVSRLIRTFISCYMRNSASSRYRCLSLWFELVACLNSACRDMIIGRSGELFLPSSQMYVRKARTFIAAHYAGRLRISDVAEELHITPNYLSSMFKQITGKTVLDYIHMTRIQAARDLLQQDAREHPLTEIAAMTGLGSARALCTLFKKTYGVSVREYLRISRELTVYHERPWDEKSDMEQLTEE